MIGRQEAQRKRDNRKVLLTPAIQAVFMVGSVSFAQDFTSTFSASNIPDYRGSRESHVYPYPFVFPIYRDLRLQADEEGIKGTLLESDGPDRPGVTSHAQELGGKRAIRHCRAPVPSRRCISCQFFLAVQTPR